jgi:inner membrane transporter RhtA
MIQASAAFATHAFDALGPFGTSGLRFSFAALILLVVVRPRLRGRSPRSWLLIAAMGTAVAAMNLCLYSAIDRIPLGTVVAIEFLGPLAVAVAGSRRRLDIVWVAAAAVGVVLVTGGLSLASGAGIAFALGAALSWALYLLFTRRVGEDSDSFDGLALAIAFSALLTSPLAVHAVAGGPALNDVLLVAGLALTGVAIPYAFEFAALRRLGVRTVSILLSLDPALAAVIGLIVLSQHLTPTQFVGVALVTIASVGVVSSRTPPAPPGPSGPPGAIPIPS